MQMIPTLIGVILITFILFNVVGGSPAAMTLGQHVSPKSLEEFDEQRGRNKPLFAGNWTGTRAYLDESFDNSAGIWQQNTNVIHKPAMGNAPGEIILNAIREYPLPLHFNLLPETGYRWEIEYTLESDSPALLLFTGITEQTQSHELQPSPGRHTAIIPFLTGKQTASLAIHVKVPEGALHISRVVLQRKTQHVLDSQLLFYLRQLCPVTWHAGENGFPLRWKGVELGVSSSTNQKVTTMLKDGILPSLSLTVPIFLIGLVVSVSLSLVCAFFRNTWIDRLLVLLSVLLMSVNYIVWIVLIQHVLGFRLGWFPVWGYESPYYLVLPVLIGVISGLGSSVRFYRTIMLDEMYRDYVRTAFAKGLSKRRVLFVHVLRNAMIPILTSCVIAIAFLYTGSLLLESFFGIPGLGYMSINAVNSSDFDVIKAIVLLGSVIYMLANLLTDISYAAFDPRVRFK